MADRTGIEWADATWNPITGCQVKSPGCKRCYAMKLAGTRMKHHPSREGLTVDTKNGRVWNGEVRFNEEWLTQPLHWTKPRMIFVCAHADLFYEAVPDEWIDRVFAVMAAAPRHTFQVLTKRPERMQDYLQRLETEPFQETVRRFAKALPTPMPKFENLAFPSRHIWLGCSVENQDWADQRRESVRLVSDMGWLTWVSYEPALGPVDWRGWEFLRWMVSGGESGSDARPTHPAWHRAARVFCAFHRIPYLFKQWGEWAPAGTGGLQCETATVLPDGRIREWDPGEGRLVHSEMVAMRRLGKKAAGRLLDGITHDGFPKVSE